MVNIINATAQEFNGSLYYLCGYYYQREGARLHRVVYKYHHGSIPKGYVVHHIDGDRSNNTIGNLRLETRHLHAKLHSNEPERIKMSQQAIKKAIAKAPEWHASEDGHEWHKEHYASMKDKMHQTGLFVCQYCGKEYEAEKQGDNLYCSRNCTSAERRASGKDDILKTCHTCGAQYLSNKYQMTKYCSAGCRVNKRMKMVGI